MLHVLVTVYVRFLSPAFGAWLQSQVAALKLMQRAEAPHFAQQLQQRSRDYSQESRFGRLAAQTARTAVVASAAANPMYCCHSAASSACKLHASADVGNGLSTDERST